MKKASGGVGRVCRRSQHKAEQLQGPDSDNPCTYVGLAFGFGFILQVLGQFGRGEIIQLILWKEHSGEEVPDSLVKGRPVIPLGKQDLSCERKFLSCTSWQKTLETILMSTNRRIELLRRSKLEVYPLCIPKWKNNHTNNMQNMLPYLKDRNKT